MLVTYLEIQVVCRIWFASHHALAEYAHTMPCDNLQVFASIFSSTVTLVWHLFQAQKALEERCGTDHPFTARANASLAMVYELAGETAYEIMT